MQYQVRLTEKAEADVSSVLAWFRDQQATKAGERWLKQLFAQIETLEARPERCRFAAEAEDTGLAIRELLVGRRQFKYRLLFLIDERTVHILRVWHGARDALRLDDLE
jgi:plasmid stabilization system protein ParE